MPSRRGPATGGGGGAAVRTTVRAESAAHTRARAYQQGAGGNLADGARPGRPPPGVGGTAIAGAPPIAGLPGLGALYILFAWPDASC
jgi:hypothetical protein